MDNQTVVDATAHAVEATLETVESVPEIVKNNPVVLAGVAVISFAVGAGVATVISNKYFKTKYEKLLDQELAETKAFYQDKIKDESTPSDLLVNARVGEIEEYDDDEQALSDLREDMISAAKEISEQEGYVAYDKPEKVETKVTATVEKTVKKNVFAGKNESDEEDFDLDDEEDKRREGKPYVVEADNFFENDPNHSQTTLTYFEGDDVMVDEADQPIRNWGVLLGHENLRFGSGSNDKNVVYVRNEKLNADYEVTRSEGKYAEEVLGYIQHSDKRSLRKFRNDD